MSALTLELIGIEKSFPGVRALRNVSMAVAPGEVHALVGENGAGKSTLIKIATGATQPDTGQVKIDGVEVANVSRAEMRRLGLRAIFQERQIAPDLTVAENVMLDDIPSRFGVVDWRALRRTARHRLDRLGVDLDPDLPVRSLPVAQLQLIEVARALSDDARIVIMDEPTAALHRSEVRALFDVVRALRDNGVSVLYISHHLDEIFELADRVTVLRDGEVIDTVAVVGLETNDLIEMMFGRRVDDSIAERQPISGAATITFDNVSVPGSLEGINLEVRAGEILAVTGGLGSGTSALASVASGAIRAASGTVHLAGVGEVTSRRVTAGHIGLLPADRKRRGLLLDEPLTPNLTLSSLASGGPLVSPKKLRSLAAVLAERSSVRAASLDVKARTLSGGNQQKLMVGRWLDVKRAAIVVDEPTAGIDIPSKFEIYEQLRGLAADGAAVLVCTTDFQEVRRVADRVIVLRDGRVVAELLGADATEHTLIELETAA